jgi:hypothetical protein
VKTRLQQPDGSYIRASKLMKDAKPFTAQDFLMQLAEGKVDLDAIPRPSTAKPPAKAATRKARAAD